jgi:hypothetical protein
MAPITRRRHRTIWLVRIPDLSLVAGVLAGLARAVRSFVSANIPEPIAVSCVAL